MVFNNICSILILIGIIFDYLYIKQLEEKVDCLQEWVEVLLGVDFKKLSKAVKEYQRGNRETKKSK